MKRTLLCAALAVFSVASEAAAVGVSGAASDVFLEQYAGGPVIMWRMPGGSTHPGGSCTAITQNSGGDSTAQASRLIAYYLSAQSTGKNFYYQYDTVTCTLVSFGVAP